VHYNLGLALTSIGELDQAIDHFKKALRINPDDAGKQNNLARMLITIKDEKLRDPAEAVRLGKRACELTHYSRPNCLDTLAVAYAAMGDFSKAIETAEKALRLIVDNDELTQKMQKRIDLYKAIKPYDNK